MTKHFKPSVSLAALMAARPSAVIGAVRNESGVDHGKIEALLKDVKSELTRISDDVKKTAEQALQQSKDTGKATDEVKAKADELLATQTKLSDAQQKLTEKLEALETRNQDLEQKLASRRSGGDKEVKSFGAQVTETDELKAFAKAGARGTLRISVNQAITSVDGSAGSLIWTQQEREIVGLPRRQMTIRNLIPAGRTTSNLIEYVRQLARTNNAAVVSEGAQKPESNYTYERADAPVRTIAHWVHVSRQAMDDAAQLQTEIDGELRYGLDYAEELEVLKGDGTGEHLEGLVPAATAYSAPIAMTGETMIDVLRLAILQASLAEYPADGIVLHPSDWTRIELLKDGENRYLWANPRGTNAPGLWGRPLLETQAMDEDEFLVGAFRMAATIYDRMDAEVLISSEDRDNFIKNMLTVRAEKRLALAVKRPGALVTGDFGNVSG
jgi:HK97 family phage major capsid protein